MSIETIKIIVGRAMAEPEFRELLFSDPDQALAGYELSPAEIALLKDLPREGLETVAGDLEERISRVRKIPGVLKFPDITL